VLVVIIPQITSTGGWNNVGRLILRKTQSTLTATIESILQLVPLRDENQIILNPKSDQNFGESGYDEIIFRLLYIHHHTLCSERYPDPLLTMRLDPSRL
jgi:hypothetical protein